MSEHFNLIETDHWPILRQKIVEERARRIDGLLAVATLEGMRKEQGFVDALDWIIDQAKPRPQLTETDDDG